MSWKQFVGTMSSGAARIQLEWRYLRREVGSGRLFVVATLLVLSIRALWLRWSEWSQWPYLAEMKVEHFLEWFAILGLGVSLLYLFHAIDDTESELKGELERLAVLDYAYETKRDIDKFGVPISVSDEVRKHRLFKQISHVRYIVLAVVTFRLPPPAWVPAIAIARMPMTTLVCATRSYSARPISRAEVVVGRSRPRPSRR